MKLINGKSELKMVKEFKWMYENFLSKDQLILVSGSEGSGKSTFVMYVVDCMINGKDIFGMKNNGDVCKNSVWLNYDNISGPLFKKMAMNFWTDNSAVSDFGEVIPNLDTPEGMALIDELIEKFDVIIIDTLSGSHLSDENSSLEMSTLFLNLKKKIKDGKVIFVITHDSKGGTYVRGSTAITAACDTILHISKNKVNFVVETDKLRGSASGNKYFFTIGDKDGFYWVEPYIKPYIKEKIDTNTDLKKEVIDAVCVGKNTSVKIRKHLKCGNGLISKVVGELISTGKLVRNKKHLSVKGS
jgi:energy-coupling factor transporter ATP-binding protein EcfA2